MTIPKQHERAVPVINEPVPQRPKTLLQRLSSGIVHALPSLPASSSKNDLINRPTTAPGLAVGRARNRTTAVESEPLLTPAYRYTGTVGPEEPCPYDPNSYHSFASIEKRRCSFCGMRGPKIVYNEPCHACKTGGPGSHITSASAHRGHSAVDDRHLAHLANSSDSVLLGPRPVTPERAANRIGNPPRVSRLPPGIIRLPAPATAKNTESHDPVAKPPSRLGMRLSGSGMHGVHLHDPHSSGTGSLTKKPAGPKLHHLHGLSNPEDFPFVHRHEIPKHAIALRDGSTSPLADRSNSPRSSSNVHGPIDYSNTVHYGGRKSPLPSNRACIQKPQVTTVFVKPIHKSGSAVIDLHASPLNAALAESEVYKKRSPKQTPTKPPQALVDATDSSITFGSQDTGSTKIGGMRLELKGGDPSSTETPRLRGGNGHKRVSTNTFSFKLKRWLLLCHGPCPEFDADSDDDLLPPRVVTPERVAKTRQRMNGKAPLPAHLCRGAPSVASSSSRPGTETIPPVTTFTTTITGPPKRSLSSRFSSTLSLSSRLRRRPESPINQAAPVTPPQVLNPPFPHLRGGADSPDKIPPTLFWLAGGTGRKPISFSGWKQSRPKQRMGGLFGMAVFGDKYRQEYQVGASTVGDVEVECSANVKVTVEDAVSVKEAESGVDVSEPDPGSNLSSIVSTAAVSRPSKEVAAGARGASPASDVDPTQRAVTPPPVEVVEDVPACSGALPVERAADLLGDRVASSPPVNNDGV